MIEKWIEEKDNLDIILDIGCGVGESTYHLGQEFKDALVIGIDKSLDRLNRNNEFKQKLPANILLVRGDIIDLWSLFLKNSDKYNILKQYILYPNPYPKQKHLSLRWQGHAIFPTIMQLGSPIEVRSNWKLYLEEFLAAASEFGVQSSDGVQVYKPTIVQTPFERKYLESSQILYRLELYKAD